MNKYRKIGVITVLALGFMLLSIRASLAVPLANGNFAAGFTSWMGEVFDDSIPDFVGPFTPQGSYGSNYLLQGGAAKLTNDDIVFTVSLFQDFDLPTIASGERLFLDYELTVNVSSSQDAFAQLSPAAGLMIPTIDLLGSSSVEITALAGEAVELFFSVDDLDFTTNDMLSVDNIIVRVEGATVPEPASVALVAAGLVFLRKRRPAVRVRCS